MPNIKDVLDIPKNLTQNTVDYLAKQFQVYYDAIFGKDSDNDNLPAVPPYILNSTISIDCHSSEYMKTINDQRPTDENVYFKVCIPVNINSISSPKQYLADPYLVPSLTRHGQGDANIISIWNNYFESHDNLIENWYLLDSNFNFSPPISPRTTGSYGHYLGCTSKNENHVDIYNISSANFTTRTAEKIYVEPSGSLNNSLANYNLINNNEMRLMLMNEMPAFTTTSVLYPYTSQRNYNTYNVTTKYGDEITIYYNDNQIIMPISPNIAPNITNNYGGININPDVKIGGIGGIGGIAVGGAGAIVNGELDLGGINFGLGGLNLGGLGLDVDMGGLTYNDIRDMFNNVLVKVNALNTDNPGFTPIEFPTYGDIKYTDRGNFYIEPIHQIDKLPTAPELNNIDTDIDFSDIGTFVGGSVNFMLDTYSGLGISSTLILSCLLITFIIRKLRGD